MASIRIANEPGDPLDMLEDMASANEWRVERATSEEIFIQYQGPWEGYKLHFYWQSRLSILRVCCAIDWELDSSRWPAINDMLNRINERLWLGHFYLSEEGHPIFRYTLILSGTEGITPEQLEDIVETAIGECDRIYPAFHFICDGKSPSEAIKSAIFDVAGEA